MIHSLSGGGAETQLRLLLESWPFPEIQNGIFFVVGSRSDISNRAIDLFPSQQRSTRHPGFLRSMMRSISRFDPHVIHIWLPEVISIPAMLIGRLQKRKVVLSYRDRRRFTRKLTYLEAALAIPCVDAIVSNHEVLQAPSYRSSVFRWLFRHKDARVIRNGVRVGSARWEPVAERPSRLICVGRLSPPKNYPRLIEALRILSAREDWSLDIWGEGESRGEIETAIASAGLGSRITLHGHTQDVQREMQRASALVLPSLSEGMPNVLVEALALGMPVIAADIEGIREVVGEEPACRWVNPLDPTDIARGIRALLDGEVDTSTLVAQGRLIASRYTLECAQEAFADLYRQMCGAS
jgi:glycosyltransferase involved in cell wall biosynthesis